MVGPQKLELRTKGFRESDRSLTSGNKLRNRNKKTPVQIMRNPRRDYTEPNPTPFSHLITNSKKRNKFPKANAELKPKTYLKALIIYHTN